MPFTMPDFSIPDITIPDILDPLLEMASTFIHSVFGTFSNFIWTWVAHILENLNIFTI